MALLSLEHVRRRFGGIVAVDDVSFDVEAGQIVGLIGPNGAGKTTVFNLITRLYKPDAGSIVFAGESLLSEPAHAIVRRGIARTFQSTELFRSMSVLENVLVGLRRGTEQRALELLDYVGLADLADRPAVSLSHAQLKRVEVARALATQPKLLLLDEPTAGMNPQETADFTSFVGRLRGEEGLAVLLIEHDMRVVMGVSDRVTVLDYGEKIAEGAPESIQKNERVIEAYLGTAAVTK